MISRAGSSNHAKPPPFVEGSAPAGEFFDHIMQLTGDIRLARPPVSLCASVLVTLSRKLY
jgi:hypothetical protein